MTTTGTSTIISTLRRQRNRKRTRRTLALALATTALVGACSRSEGTAERTPPLRSGPGEPLAIDTDLISSLVAFDECDALLSYLRTEGAKLVGPYGFEGGFGTVLAEGRATSGPAATAAPTSGASDAQGGAESKSAAVAGTDFSATNVQEEGVDEPDLVKTDGTRLVTIAAGQLQVVDLTDGLSLIHI